VNFRGCALGGARGVDEAVSLEQCVEDLREVLRAAGAAPVVVAHCVGWLAAVGGAAERNVSALALISPPAAPRVPWEAARPLRLLRLKYLLLLSLGRPIRIAEKDFARLWLSSLEPECHGEVLKNLVSESSVLVKLLFQRETLVEWGPGHCPVLVMGGAEDPVAPLASMRRTAEVLGAELREYPGHGHWMLGEEGWETVVNDLHRWLVRSLGEKILLAKL